MMSPRDPIVSLLLMWALVNVLVVWLCAQAGRRRESLRLRAIEPARLPERTPRGLTAPLAGREETLDDLAGRIRRRESAPFDVPSSR
jgi:hypothetical protein